jgi:uncharacterized protein with GYD domain
MAHYLIQLAYTSEAYGSMLRAPQNRFEVVRPAIEAMGGKLEGAWMAFGDYDVVVIVQMPDNVSAAAFGMAVAAGGAVKSYKTTPLLTPEEAVASMKKAAGSSYRPPGG